MTILLKDPNFPCGGRDCGVNMPPIGSLVRVHLVEVAARVDPFFVTAMWGAMILALIAINHFSSRWRRSTPLAEAAGTLKAEQRPPPSDG